MLAVEVIPHGGVSVVLAVLGRAQPPFPTGVTSSRRWESYRRGG